MEGPPRDNRMYRLIFPVLAFALAVLFPLLACPFENAPFDDDFSYARMARSVAETGTYRYDGWVAPIVGPQAYYGGLFIKIFGPSHIVLRGSVALLAGLSAVLLYHMGRLAKLSRPLALQVALGCMLSPIVVPLSVSFMTDVPALFLALVAVVAALHATTAAIGWHRTSFFLLFLLAVVLGGMVRQTNWMLAVGLAPVVIAHTRTHRMLWSCLMAIALLAIYLINHRHADSSFVITDSLGQLVRGLVATSLTDLHARVIRVAHSALIVGLPAMVALIPLARKTPRKVMAGTVVVVAMLGLLLQAQGQLPDLLDPYLGNFITPCGLLGENTDIPGDRPDLAPVDVLRLFAVFRWMLLAFLATATVLTVKTWWPPVRTALANNRALVFLSLLAILTLGPSLLRTITALGFDRYFISALPAIFVGTGLLQMHAGRTSGARLVWTMIFLGGLFGTALTFDYHAAMRARLNALSTASNLGIHRNQIAAGFELDLDEQLNAWSYANVGVLSNPPDARLTLQRNPGWTAPMFWSWPFSPAINPQYVITRSPLPGYIAQPVATIEYSTCFPPFRRTLILQGMADPIIPPYFPPPPITRPPAASAAGHFRR